MCAHQCARRRLQVWQYLMKILTGLSRQIALTMMAVVLGVILLIILGSYAFYAALLMFWPDSFPPNDDWAPSGLEWGWILSTTAVALTLALTVAIKLSRRILLPLTSVAESLRQIAQGDLDARAVTNDSSLSEAALLVHDFNTMAERLQRMAQEQTFWNAAIAHELRTPVTILRGRLQGLAEGVFEPDAAQFRSLLAQVEGLTRLIEDLRVVGLADSGHLQIQLCDADLSGEIKAAMQLFEPSLHAAGLSPVLDLEDKPVRCDPARILQALLENARRHAVPGGVRVQMRVEHDSSYLSVEDDGPGIAETLAAHVFDAFQRGDSARTREGAGSGLGLAVVRAIALAHGGQATCRPSLTGGTLFEVRWPNKTETKNSSL
ncbi:ATP-binding protein [Prodigiosinella confusarubida]|nr:ATP-binding protein [Serratia sp. ATCC 39006]